MDDYQEPPEPTIEEERDYYKRERNRIQSELATAQAEKHGLEDVVLATRNMSIEAFDRIRALIGASPNDPRPCETLVSELIESLRSQLQTAMEERDEFSKRWKEANRQIGLRDSRLEEAEKALGNMAISCTCDQEYVGSEPVNHRDGCDLKVRHALLSRLSASRSTENKTNEA